MTPKIKDKKYFDETVFNGQIWITGDRGLFVDKGSGSGWPKKTGSATLYTYLYFILSPRMMNEG